MSQKEWAIKSGPDIGRAIADIRQLRSMTQAELADASGIERTWLTKMEAGRTNRLLEHLLRVLRRLGADVRVTLPADGDRCGTA